MVRAEMRTKGNQFCTDCLFCSCNSTLWCMYLFNKWFIWKSVCCFPLHTHTPCSPLLRIPVLISNTVRWVCKIAVYADHFDLGRLAARCVGTFWSFTWQRSSGHFTRAFLACWSGADSHRRMSRSFVQLEHLKFFLLKWSVEQVVTTPSSTHSSVVLN